MDLISRIAEIEAQALEAVSSARTSADLIDVDNRFLSKRGALSELLKGLRDVQPGDRPQVGARANEAKTKLEHAIGQKKAQFDQETLNAKLASERVDFTLPSCKVPLGSTHPVTKTISEIVGIFRKLGFELAEGPDVETEFNNFDALNMAEDHPARDMQDTFYLPKVGDQHPVLRTHTSPVQIRTMQSRKPPVRIICAGSAFRADYDLTHIPMFHQIEGLYVDKNVSFAELKGCLLFFAREMFGTQSQVRLRPSYFPFVEPGAEVDITCVLCKGTGTGCRACKTTGWLEILGAGMVHPRVFEAVGYDPKTVTGFAFGMGIERIAMLKLGIPDLRLIAENDIRFLRQFGT